MLVLVNPQANAGRGAERWARVEAELRRRGTAFDVRRTASALDAARAAGEAVARGERCLVAAGGDGTAHALLNALMDPSRDAPRADVALGAVGIGSSNDLHKPFDVSREVAGVPARLDEAAAARVDVGKATLTHVDGRVETRYFLLNASMGLVAEGNAYFNGPDRVLRWLKRRNVEAAILYTALVNVVRCPGVRLTLQVDGGPADALDATNVAVLKRVAFAGGMRYDTPVRPDDGRFDVNVWLRTGRLRTVRTLAGLYAGRFSGLPHARCARGARVRLVPERPAPLELDGEVAPVASAELVVLERVLRLCG